MKILKKILKKIKDYINAKLPHTCSYYKHEKKFIEGSEYKGSMLVEIECFRCGRELPTERVTVYY